MRIQTFRAAGQNSVVVALDFDLYDAVVCRAQAARDVRRFVEGIAHQQATASQPSARSVVRRVRQPSRFVHVVAAADEDVIENGIEFSTFTREYGECVVADDFNAEGIEIKVRARDFQDIDVDLYTDNLAIGRDGAKHARRTSGGESEDQEAATAFGRKRQRRRGNGVPD